jgi:hypothetical protein
MDDIAELDPVAWQEGLMLFNCMNSPWFKLLDRDKYEQHVDRVQGLDLQAVASCHSPVIPRSKIDEAFTTIRGIVNLEPPPQPGQPDLDALMHALARGEQYIWEPPSPNGG